MNLNSNRALLIPGFILFVIILSGLFFLLTKSQVTIDSDRLEKRTAEVSLLSIFDLIQVSESNKYKYLVNNLNENNNGDSSNINFYLTKLKKDEYILRLNNQLSKENWQQTENWGHNGQLSRIEGMWEKGSLQLKILIFDDLDTAGINGLSNNYGITGLNPASSLIVVYQK